MRELYGTVDCTMPRHGSREIHISCRSHSSSTFDSTIGRQPCQQWKWENCLRTVHTDLSVFAGHCSRTVGVEDDWSNVNWNIPINSITNNSKWKPKLQFKGLVRRSSRRWVRRRVLRNTTDDCDRWRDLRPLLMESVRYFGIAAQLLPMWNGESLSDIRVAGVADGR